MKSQSPSKNVWLHKLASPVQAPTAAAPPKKLQCAMKSANKKPCPGYVHEMYAEKQAIRFKMDSQVRAVASH